MIRKLQVCRRLNNHIVWSYWRQTAILVCAVSIILSSRTLGQFGTTAVQYTFDFIIMRKWNRYIESLDMYEQEFEVRLGD